MKIIEEHDQGDSIIIEQEIQEQEPFTDTETLTDPDTVTITIKAPDESLEVDEEPMTRADTGKYYYIWNTAQDLQQGDYEIEIKAKKNNKQGITDDEYIKLR